MINVCNEIEEGNPYKTKLAVGGYKYPVTITRRKDRLWFDFKFNKALTNEIKISLSGAKWHGFEDVPIKQWSCSVSQRTGFRLGFLEGRDTHKRYNQPLLAYKPKRSLYSHQCDYVSHIITRHYAIGALEMGTGKTLSAIEAMEWLAIERGIKGWFYVAPKSALASVQLEFEKWRALVIPQFITYDELRAIIANWPQGVPPPAGVIFDESSRVKNPSAARTEAAQYLANNIREYWDENGAVVLMSGSPAPKEPSDWWSQCEIACPGFIRESSIIRCRERMAIIAERQSEAGGTFKTIAAWKDDEKKCDRCGKLESDPDHDIINSVESWFHGFVPSVNEVSLLYRRMAGLTMVKLKKNCLDLPPKQYKTIRCKPSEDIMNAAKLIVASGGNGVKTQILLRELSDGFQYQQEEVGMEICPACEGTKTRKDWIYVGPEEDYEKMIELQSAGEAIPETHFRQIDAACSNCSGTGQSVKYVREAKQVPCPKEDVVTNILDEHDEIGRIVLYGGFTGSIDRLVNICVKMQWDVIRVDGRGWWTTMTGVMDAKSMLRNFQTNKERFPRVAFIGQPGAAGMGLTLTASPTLVYYSNDFNAESRIQSEDRIHRPGMDINRGATIIDIFHLPTDEKVLDNLKKKRRLQDITMGEIKAALEDVYRE